MAEFVSLHNLVRRARARYRDIDKRVALELVPSHPDIKCKRGCASCCYQLVACTFMEAVIVADSIVRNQPGEVVAILERLDAAVARLAGRAEYMLAQTPCALLKPGAEPWTGECTVYSSRPLACRLEFVVTDPVWCRPDGVYDIARIDTEAVQAKLTEAITGRDSLLSLYGPFPVYVGEALRMMELERQPNTKLLAQWMDWLWDVLHTDGANKARRRESYVPWRYT